MADASYEPEDLCVEGLVVQQPPADAADAPVDATPPQAEITVSRPTPSAARSLAAAAVDSTLRTAVPGVALLNLGRAVASKSGQASPLG